MQLLTPPHLITKPLKQKKISTWYYNLYLQYGFNPLKRKYSICLGRTNCQ